MGSVCGSKGTGTSGSSVGAVNASPTRTAVLMVAFERTSESTAFIEPTPRAPSLDDSPSWEAFAVSNAILTVLSQKQTSHTYIRISTYCERRIDGTHSAISHLKIPDFVPLPEQVQRLRIEGPRTGSHVRFFAINGVIPSTAQQRSGTGGDSLLKTKRRDKGEVLSERTTA